MARFCDKCGAHLNDSSAFCPECGAAVMSPATAAAMPYQEVSQPSAYTPPAQPVQGHVAPAQVVQPASGAKGGSVLKIVLVVMAILALGALGVVGSLIYLGHKVVSKIEDKAAAAGLSTSALGKSENTFQGDACRFLTRTEVSKAIGVAITGTKSEQNSCDYLARGTAANMTSKHLSAIMGKNGGDKATQEKFERLTGQLFSTQEKNAEALDPNSPDTTVLAVSIDQGSAQAQMRLDSKVLGALGPASGSSNLQGIGDEAFVAANGMMLVRKGDTLIRITYISCPCNTDQIKPLARKLAAAF